MGRLRLAFGVLLLVGGAALAGTGYTDYRAEQSNSPSVASVEGTVQSATVERLNRTDEETGGTVVDYHAVINYTYTYEGTEYTGNDLYRDQNEVFSTQTDAVAAVSQYDNGTTVTVKVEEGEPENSYLIAKSEPPIPELKMGAGALLALVGLYLLARER